MSVDFHVWPFLVMTVLIFVSRPSIPRVLSLLTEKVCKNTKNVCKALIVASVDFADSRPLDFARTDYQGPPLTSLIDIIEYVKPTALLCLSTIHVCTRDSCMCGSLHLSDIYAERIYGRRCS
jgi:hypothetical protein